MKKNVILLALAVASSLSYSQTWNLNLNNITSGSPNLGTISNHPINFFTNNTQRMSLSTAGVLSINNLTGSGNRFLLASPEGNLSAWAGTDGYQNKILYGDATWKIPPFTLDGNSNLHSTDGAKVFLGSDLSVGGIVSISNNFVMDVIPATSTTPLTYRTSPNQSPGVYPPVRLPNNIKAPCNVWYKDPVQWSGGAPTLAAWLPPTNNVMYDLFQIYESANQTSSELSLGIFNGDGILALEPLQTLGSSTSKLKLNPGCMNDVFICEGGGYTKMFNGAGVVGDFTVFKNGVATNPAVFYIDNIIGHAAVGRYVNSSAALAVGQGDDNGLALSLTDNTTTTNQNFFDVYGNGQTLVGPFLQPANAMLSVGQASKTEPALRLTENISGIANRDFFKVFGSGYVEINVLSPGNLPNQSNGSGRVISVKDATNGGRDLFALKGDGKVYAREVEVSAIQPFPDYVFSKNYKLSPLTEVEVYIQHNSHLPGFEKAEYYEKNGMNVNTLLVKQQEKIEELTLYIIELGKRVKELESNK